MLLYQIVVSGNLALFSGHHRFHSKVVYREEPSQLEIDKFIDACCGDGTKLYDLNRDTVKTKILELEMYE